MAYQPEYNADNPYGSPYDVPSPDLVPLPPQDPSMPDATAPAGTTTPAPGGVDPWSVAPPDGNWEAWFRANTKGQLSPAQLIGLEATLAKHGIKVLRNAAGVAGKITLPNGQIVDVIEKAGAGGTTFQWLTGDGGADGADVPDADWFTENLPSPDAYETLARPEGLRSPYVAPEFQAPEFADLYKDQGYQSRLMAGVRGRDMAAAAKGSILSGGHQKAIERYAQEFGSNEYADLYSRRRGEFETKAGLGLGARQINESAYQDDVTNRNTQFNNRYRTYRDAIGDRFRVAELGANATVAGRP